MRLNMDDRIEELIKVIEEDELYEKVKEMLKSQVSNLQCILNSRNST